MYFKNSDYTNKKYEDLYLNFFVDIIWKNIGIYFCTHQPRKENISGILQLIYSFPWMSFVKNISGRFHLLISIMENVVLKTWVNQYTWCFSHSICFSTWCQIDPCMYHAILCREHMLQENKYQGLFLVSTHHSSHFSKQNMGFF